jgi:hypothetical protein
MRLCSGVAADNLLGLCEAYLDALHHRERGAAASSPPPRGNEVQYGAAAVPEGTRPLTITTTEIQPQRPRWPRESEAISDPTQKTSNLGFGCGEDEIEHCGPFQDREQIGD